MGRLDVTDALTRARAYPHGIVSFVGRDGYPVNVAAPFVVGGDGTTIELGPLAGDARPEPGQPVEVTFSHIRPQPGVGYDERRYVNLWGAAELQGDRVRLTPTRATGWDEQETPFFEYAEHGVPEGRAYIAELGAKPRLSGFWTFFLATRLPFLTATLVPVGLGAAVAARHGLFRWGWFVAALVAAIAVHLGLNMANDIFDDASGADAANVTPTPFSGGSRVIQYGLVSRRAMIAGCAAFYALAVGLGLFLAAERGWGLLVIGAVGVALSLAYSAPPLRLVHRGLGEPVTALGFGPVMSAGTYYAITGHWRWEAALASLPVAVLIALVLYVNQVPDRHGDAAAGKRTLIVRWSAPAVQRGYAVSVVAAFAGIVVLAATGVTPWWTLVALAPAPMGWRVRRDLRAHYDEPYALLGAMQANIGLHLFTGLLMIAGYVVATVT
jgi:1,4-dihydroxy-2-naphthoate octaprenyltransferase